MCKKSHDCIRKTRENPEKTGKCGKNMGFFRKCTKKIGQNRTKIGQKRTRIRTNTIVIRLKYDYG